jgi:predicted cobalt transporter CbtA
MSRLLKLGAVAGLVGGVALALFLRLVGEGPINDAIALERSRAAAGTAHDELYTRAAQQIGGMLGAAVFGVCAGVVLTVVFALVRHRLTARDDWRRAITVAATAFITIALVPFLKYPANPPAVGNPDTINERTALYLVMVAWSVVATWAAWRLSRWLRVQGHAEYRRVPIVLAAWAVIVAVGYIVLPGSPDAVDAPATLVWRFRAAALGGQALFWSATGLTLGWLLLRAEGSLAAPALPDAGRERDQTAGRS